MFTKQNGKNLFLVDLETGGFKNLIASYVLKGKGAVIVESGPTSSVPNLLSGLRELNVRPEEVAFVALTHVHIDQGGGTGTLIKSLPNARVIVHPKGAWHLAHPAKLWEASKHVLGEVAEMFGKPEPVPEDRIILASEGMTLEVGEGLRLKVLESLGHAAHNVSYYEYLNEGVFPGDGAGAYFSKFDEVLPATPPPFRPDIALLSLEKLIRLDPKVLYYSHFGRGEDGVERLCKYMVQVELWLNLALEGVKNGDSTEDIRERILQRDDAARKMAPALRAHPVYRKTVIENSTQGFIDFARTPKT